MNKPRIYLASSWRNSWQPEVLAFLRNAGFEVYDFRNPAGGTGFAWSDIDPAWENWNGPSYLESLDHPLAERGFRSDMGALAACDACVLLLPSGRSAHLELGYAAGAGKFTAVLIRGKNEPELMVKMCNWVGWDLCALADAIRQRFGE